MRNWLRTAIRWLFPIFVVLIAIWIVGSAKSFQQCIREIKREEPQQAPKEGLPHFLIVLGRYKPCSGVFLSENHDAVIAAGTLGLMIFTGSLWWATRRLQQFAEIQSRDMRRSISLARANRVRPDPRKHMPRGPRPRRN
jgi:hypothetical protein